jgi:hypothetical protein
MQTGKNMAAQDAERGLLDLYTQRRTIVQALLYVRGQMEALTDHISGIEKQIRDLEHGQLTVPQQRRKFA